MATRSKYYISPTDEDLRGRQLEIEDPHGQPNLANHIPKGVEPLRILNVYRFNRYPAEKAYCAKCEARRHRDGFTVELENGTFALLGSKCGSDLWGESWAEVAGNFKDELERAGTIIGFKRILPELKSLVTLFSRWRPTIRLVAKNQRNFQSAMGNVFQDLRNASVRSDNSLMIYQRVRDVIAESAFETRYGKPPDDPIFTTIERVAHRLEGGAFFEYTNVETLFELSLQDLNSAILVGADTALHSQNKLRLHRAKVSDAKERLERVAMAVRAIHIFYKSDNLIRVAQWMERSDASFSGEIRFEVKGNAIIDRVKGRRIGLPPEYRMVDLDPLRRLQKL